MEVLWSDPRPPHSIENVGDAELLVLMVALKDRALRTYGSSSPGLGEDARPARP
jgi:hypothetical protein